MRLVLYGESGAAYWLCADLTCAKPRKDSSAVLEDDAPGKASCSYLLRQFPGLAQPVHCLSTRKTRGGGSFWKTHFTSYAYPPNSFWHIGSGLYVPSPELCFVQACTTTTDHRALKIGAALCGTFSVRPQSPAGLARREPLTTPGRIQKYIDRASCLHGAKKAARLARHIPQNAASPPEAFLCLVLALPGRWGGYHLPPPLMNKRLKSGRKSRAITQRKSLVPDLYWPQAKVALEFDSDAIHLSSAQATRDSTKRLALENSGHRTVTVTTNQLASRDRMSHIAQRIGQELGHISRNRSRDFSCQQNALFAEGWSLNWLFDPAWLANESAHEQRA